MRDLTLRLERGSGPIATLGEALGRAGVSVEGGGVFGTGSEVCAHFLVSDVDATKACAALRDASIEVLASREVLVQRLDQEVPGQLGAICRHMTESGVRIEVLYSDHANQLVLVVDDMEKGRAASAAWIAARTASGR